MNGIEYIVDFGDKSSAFVGLAMAESIAHGATIHEPIVRCADCLYYEKDPDPIDPGYPMRCADNGRDILEPDGFCAWAERR